MLKNFIPTITCVFQKVDMVYLYIFLTSTQRTAHFQSTIYGFLIINSNNNSFPILSQNPSSMSSPDFACLPLAGEGGTELWGFPPIPIWQTRTPEQERKCLRITHVADTSRLPEFKYGTSYHGTSIHVIMSKLPDPDF